VVTTYVTTIGLAVVLVNISLIGLPTPLLDPWLIPATSERLQLKVAPVVALVAVYVNVVPLQIAPGVSVLLNEGIGATLTVTFSPVLLQLFAVVTTTYVTTIGLAVVLVNISLIPPAVGVLTAAWLIPATAARVHVKLAPPVALVGV
jgi:hypothetical protein